MLILACEYALEAMYLLMESTAGESSMTQVCAPAVSIVPVRAASTGSSIRESLTIVDYVDCGLIRQPLSGGVPAYVHRTVGAVVPLIEPYLITSA